MGSSPKKLRLGTGEGDPAAASSKGKEKAPTVDDLLSEGDPAAASSKGEEKAPSLDDMLSDASSDGSGRASRDFSSVSEARDFQDADLAPPLSKRSEVGEENAKSWKLTTTQLADQLELEGGKRDKFRKLLANQRRSQKKSASRQKSTTVALASVATAYNKGKLRLGDMVDPDFKRRKQRPDHGRRAHPRAWSLSGTIRFAFSSIGALDRSGKSSQTRRGVDAIAGVALAALAHQRQALRSWSRFYLPASGPCKWVCLTRSHDSTPIKIRFGQLHELQQFARYWYKRGKAAGDNTKASRAEAQLLTAEEIKRTGGLVPSHGIVELMAQSGCIAWPEERDAFVVQQRRNIFFPPKFLQGTTGSNIFACLQQAGAGLTFEKCFEMTSFVDYVVLILGSDLAASCGRAKHEVLFRCKHHNEGALRAGQGVVVFIDVQCAAHVIHREIEGHFASKELSPHPPATPPQQQQQQ